MFTTLRPVRSLLFALALVCLALLLGVESHADVVYRVNTTADIHPFPGSTTISLRSALDSANKLAGADSIALPAGTYALTITGSGDNTNFFGDLDILDSVTITGAGPDKTIIDGNAIDRVFDIPISSESISVVLNNLTIQNGKLTATNS